MMRLVSVGDACDIFATREAMVFSNPLPTLFPASQWQHRDFRLHRRLSPGGSGAADYRNAHARLR
jgi:hypothetical protein